MNTHERAVMQQALEALESAHSAFINCDITLLDLRSVNESIVAIQTALQQKREWVEPTDEQIDVVISQFDEDQWFEIARAVLKLARDLNT